MTLHELPHEGTLTRELQKLVGREFSFTERLRKRIHGLGRLQYVSGNAILDNFYEEHSNAVRTHFDWTTGGAIIRLRTVTKLFAFGIAASELEAIELVRKPDNIYAKPFTIFWALWLLGAPFMLARWFMGKGSWYFVGPCEITLKLKHESLHFSLHGDDWKNCLQTFQRSPLGVKVSARDERVGWDG